MKKYFIFGLIGSIIVLSTSCSQEKENLPETYSLVLNEIIPEERFLLESETRVVIKSLDSTLEKHDVVMLETFGAGYKLEIKMPELPDYWLTFAGGQILSEPLSSINKFVRNAFRNGNVATTGTDLVKVLPPVSRFSPGGERSKKRETVLDKLTRFFERFFDISSGVF